jgi:hypothetical protein
MVSCYPLSTEKQQKTLQLYKNIIAHMFSSYKPNNSIKHYISWKADSTPTGKTFRNFMATDDTLPRSQLHTTSLWGWPVESSPRHSTQILTFSVPN